MEHRSLGRSGLKVPVLCLGAMTFGKADEKSFIGGERGGALQRFFASTSSAADIGATVNSWRSSS